MIPQVDYPSRLPLNQELYSFYDNLSSTIVNTLAEYCHPHSSVTSLEMLRILKLSRELEFIFPRSGTLFPRRDDRTQILERRTFDPSDERFSTRRNVLKLLCSYGTTIAYLTALRQHIERCHNEEPLDSMTPCHSLTCTLISISENPKRLRMPPRSNFEIVHRLYSQSLYAYASNAQAIPTSHSHFTSPADDASRPSLMNLSSQYNSHVQRLSPNRPIEKASYTMFYSNVDTSIELELSDDHPVSVPTLQFPPPPPDTLENDTPVTQDHQSKLPPNQTKLRLPGLPESVVFNSNLFDCILRSMNEQYFRSILEKLNKTLFNRDPRLAFIKHFLTEIRNTRALLTSHESSDAPTISDIATITYHVIFFMKYGNTHRSFRHPHFVTKQDFENTCPTIIHCLSKYFDSSRSHDQIEIYQRSAHMFPRIMSPQTLRQTIELFEHLHEYYRMTDYPSDPLIFTQTPDLEFPERALTRAFPRMNRTSFHLKEYFSSLGENVPADISPVLTFLARRSEEHDSGQTDWFTNRNVPALGLNVNDEHVTTLYSDFTQTTILDWINPRLLQSEERQALRSLGYPPRYWRITQSNSSQRGFRLRIPDHYDDELEYQRTHTRAP